MATGKKAKDIFTKTTKPADIGLEVAPRVKGRPKNGEPYQKVTVCLYDRQTLWLDKLGLAIREKTGKHVARAELVRAIVDHASAWVRPDGPAEDFDKAVRSLLKDI
ncbi:MAG: hypothetical protein QM330_08220 [Acidobacteriota bacterium]|jgi:hypothetical protein|nr:hypothetical protein [Acidobacteriota bacterium]